MQRLSEEAWNQNNVDVVDEIVAVDFVNHNLWPSVYFHGPDKASDREQIKYNILHFRSDFPDLHITIDQLITAEDKIITVMTHRGTPKKGDESIIWASMTIYRIAGDKIAEAWVLWERLGMWQQLGLVPPTPELSAQFPR